MAATNLGIVWGMNLIKRENEGEGGPAAALKDSQDYSLFCTRLIENFDKIFPKPPPSIVRHMDSTTSLESGKSGTRLSQNRSSANRQSQRFSKNKKKSM
eukprot:Awhi_evm1s10917